MTVPCRPLRSPAESLYLCLPLSVFFDRGRSGTPKAHSRTTAVPPTINHKRDRTMIRRLLRWAFLYRTVRLPFTKWHVWLEPSRGAGKHPGGFFLTWMTAKV